MPHVTVIKAHMVLENKHDYPEIIVSHAQEIVLWHHKKRNAMKLMWENRWLWYKWLKARNQSVKRSVIERRRDATVMLKREGLSKELEQYFYLFYQFFRKTKSSNALWFSTFEANLKLLAYDNYEVINRWYTCVNAKRTDYSLDSVEFLRYCSHSNVAEILSWKLLERN